MTILPDDRYLSTWQRAKARLQGLIRDFKGFCADDIARLPDGWKPKQAEKGGRGSDGY
jgi:hypothetical protein